jgi:hypothetical protein
LRGLKGRRITRGFKFIATSALAGRQHVGNATVDDRVEAIAVVHGY